MEQQDTQPIKNFADVNGIKMYYEVHGAGSVPLVLIHGGGSMIETSFENTLPLFAKNRKVIAMDLQAHGRTSDREAPLTFEQDADDVAALIKSLGIKQAHILGFSNGGNTAMKIAMRHPELVHKLVAVSSFYQRKGMMPGFFEGMAFATLRNMPDLLKRYFLKVTPDPAKLQNMHDKDRDRMLAFTDWSDQDLGKISAASLLILGNKDVVTIEHALEMSELIPNAGLIVLPGNHGSFMGEVCTVVNHSKIPEFFVAAVEEFLD